METQQIEQKPLIWIEKGDLAYWTDTALNIEKVRIAAQVRISHLKKYGGTSPETVEFFKRVTAAEEFADQRLSDLISVHPTWPWAKRIAGIGKENYPKGIGLIEKFGRFYDLDDPLIPYYVEEVPQNYQTVVKGQIVQKTGIFVKGIERLTTPSKLWKYSGLHTDNGRAPKRSRGKKLEFNAELRMVMVGRLAANLIMANGIWHQKYGEIHDEIVATKSAAGIKIIPTPKERMCPECNLVVGAKATRYCPNCGSKLTLKNEPEGYLFLGHIHRMAIRETMKCFEFCIWKVWREALGLPVKQPYSVEFMAHKPIDPWEMVDREEEEAV